MARNHLAGSSVACKVFDRRLGFWPAGRCALHQRTGSNLWHGSGAIGDLAVIAMKVVHPREAGFLRL